MFYFLLFLLMATKLYCADPANEKRLIHLGKEVARLRLDSNEPSSNIPFKDLIAENDKKGVASIFARVKSGDHHKIYDAYSLNNLVFGDQPVAPVAGKKLKDPMRNTDIDEIRYFILPSKDNDVLITIGSTTGMKQLNRLRFVRTILKANDPDESPADRALSFNKVGALYARGIGIRKANAQQALYWFNKAANQSENKRAQYRALYNIAQLYQQGSGGIKKDYQKARDYYQAVIKQTDSIGSREWGGLNLARISEKGGHGVEPNWSEALLLYTYLAEYATIPEVKAQAKSVIDEYYIKTEKLKEQAFQAYMHEAGHMLSNGEVDGEQELSSSVELEGRPEDEIAPDEQSESASAQLKQSLGFK